VNDRQFAPQWIAEGGGLSTMDITTLGAVGEFVSGIAVLITLIYLAYQTRLSVRMHQQSVTDLNAQIFSQNADGWVDFFLQTSKDERLSDISGKLKNGVPLDASELVSADHFLTAFCLRLENIEYQRLHLGVDGIDTLVKKQIGVYADSPDFQDWWKQARTEGFTNWFVDTVDSVMRER
jgi:hypothetical protein